LPIWKRTLFILLAAAIGVIFLEAGVRVIFAVYHLNSAYLVYPRNSELSPYEVAVLTQSPVTQSSHTNTLGGLPPGVHLAAVNDRTLHEVTINDSGFRGKDWFAEQPAAASVLLLGGSSTFSAECPDGETYPDRLGELLAQELGEGVVEVYNLGFNGANTSEVLTLLETALAHATPDVVTICSAFNNLYGSTLTDLRPSAAPFHRRALLGRSLLYTTLYRAWTAWELRTATFEVVLRRYQRDLKEIAHLSRVHGFKLVFILQPMATSDSVAWEAMGEQWNDSGEGLAGLRLQIDAASKTQPRMLQEMSDIALQQGVHVVDPRAAFHGNHKEFFAVFLHLSPAGSRALAKSIVDHLAGLPGGLRDFFAPSTTEQ
jgi:hypothetical protein